MKAVLISIRPKWCERIASGRKTIEVRKTRPKIETPLKCYIYCTQPSTKDPHQLLEIHGSDGKIRKANGKVIGEFVCDKIECFDYAASEFAYAVAPSDIACIMPMSEEKALRICREQGCLSNDDILSYFGDEEWKAYFWHISDLKIYDKPKELSEFASFCRVNEKRCASCEHYLFDNDELNGYRRWCGVYRSKPLTRPPQSWCYVEENV